jgi:hypothetical protein
MSKAAQDKPVKVKKKVGRPAWTPNEKSIKAQDQIVEWISNGKTLREFCRQEDAPAWPTVYDWLQKDPEFSKRFARARELGADSIAQECFDIADNSKNDWIDRENKDGSTSRVIDTEHIQRSKLRIETRIKLLAKWNPKLYGEKIDVTTEGKTINPMEALLASISGTSLTTK